ncbi:MAG: SUMF1/EgtB/PvdO family nonheme iron enzyme, partial [Treponema sp.]|nr:SUMF1/EgtB/PvdO family nonheme iron enzyme [Treponema sp.]
MKAKSICLCALFAAESLFAFAVPSASTVAQDFVTVIPSGQTVQVNNFAGTIGSQSIKGFSISKFEVTQDLYNSVMGSNPSSFKNNPAAGEVQGRRPVENITWYDAVFFCNQLTAQTLGAAAQCYTINDVKRDAGGKIVSATVTCDLTKTGYR